MGLFSFGKKDDDTASRRRGAEPGSGRRSSQGQRVERRSRRPDRTGDAEAMLLDPTLPEKQRARRRLVGAIALVVAAIVILPMVLDSHPKPVTDDIAIDIPSHPTPVDGGPAARDDAEDTQAGVAPDNPAAASGLAATAPQGASAAALAATQTAQNTAAPATATSAAPATTVTSTRTSQTTQTAQSQTKPSSSTSKPAAQTMANAAATGSQSARSNAAAQANQANPAKPGTADKTAAADATPPAAPPGSRYAVQLGVFTNEATARNWVTKLKAAGVPAYTEQRKQADGSTRTLLRAGPFADRAAATDAIAKVRGAGLMAGANGAAE